MSSAERGRLGVGVDLGGSLALSTRLRARRTGRRVSEKSGGVALAAADGRVAAHVWGFAVAAVPALSLWRRGAMGGGAAKLLMAMGACAGLATTARTEVAAAVLVCLTFAGRGRVWKRALFEVTLPGSQDPGVALAPYFAAAFVLQEVVARVSHARQG